MQLMNTTKQAEEENVFSVWLGDTREYISLARDNAASTLRVTPQWIDAAFGCILFVALNAACKELASLAFPLPQADTAAGAAAGAAAGRALAVIVFAALQQLAGLPVDDWLRLRADAQRVDPNPLFQSGSPLAGVTFAFMFAVPVASCAQLAGVPWLPDARPFPGAPGCVLRLLVAPLSEELFFRAWLLMAFERAGGSPTTGIIASAALFGLFNVPVSAVLAGSSALLVYEMLGAYLAFLYQRSGGSLPFVFIVHATCNLIVLSLRAAQVGSTLPFG